MWSSNGHPIGAQVRGANPKSWEAVPQYVSTDMNAQKNTCVCGKSFASVYPLAFFLKSELEFWTTCNSSPRKRVRHFRVVSVRRSSLSLFRVCGLTREKLNEFSTLILSGSSKLWVSFQKFRSKPSRPTRTGRHDP